MSNPYSPPLSGQAVDSSYINESVIEVLRTTGPWLRFMSILGFIGAGFMMLAAAAMLGMSAIGFAGTAGLPSWLGLFYVLFGALYIYPSLLLWRSASSIGRVVAGEGESALVEHLRLNRSLWKFIGISVIAVFALYILGIVAAVGFGLFNATH